jgi:hypothetical protein
MWRVVRLCEREGRREMSELGSRASFIPRESGGGPVHAPCPMQRSRIPDAGLPSVHLLLLHLEITQSINQHIDSYFT